MPFIYFVPAISRETLVPSADRLEVSELPGELARTLADCERTPRDMTIASVDGPLGLGPGLLLIPTLPGAEAATVRVETGQQWQLAFEGRYAFALVEKTNPEDFRRRAQLPGYQIEDAGGRTWQIPIARSPQPDQPFGSLPQTFYFGAKGVERRIRESSREAWDRAGRIWNYIHGPASGRGLETEAWVIEQAAWFLGVNYRLGRNEINCLSYGRPVLDQAAVFRIALAAIDFDLAQAAIAEAVEPEKNCEAVEPPPSYSNSSRGDSAACPIIVPVVAD